MKHLSISIIVGFLLLTFANGLWAQSKKQLKKQKRADAAAQDVTAQSTNGAPPPKADSDEAATPSDSGKEVQEPTDETENRATAIRSQLTVKVVNPDLARVAMKKTAAELGGYATRITDSSIIVKLPPKKLEEAIDTFAKQGILIEKTIEREDLTLEIAQLEGKLTSQRSILTKLRSFFDDSDFAATLKIERSMSRLVSEIEAVKGRLRLLFDQTKWAVVEVNFRFREREKVLYVSSPFEWLNSATLSTFMEEF